MIRRRRGGGRRRRIRAHLLLIGSPIRGAQMSFPRKAIHMRHIGGFGSDNDTTNETLRKRENAARERRRSSDDRVLSGRFLVQRALTSGLIGAGRTLRMAGVLCSKRIGLGATLMMTTMRMIDKGGAALQAGLDAPHADDIATLPASRSSANTAARALLWFPIYSNGDAPSPMELGVRITVHQSAIRTAVSRRHRAVAQQARGFFGGSSFFARRRR